MDINHLNLIMVEQNKQKEYRENFNRNYSEILKRLSYKPLTRREILKETGIKISKQALIKNYLKPMFDKKEIGFLDKSKKNKGNMEVLRDTYNKKWEANAKIYYSYTPNSAKFHQDLSNTFKHLPNQESYKELMDDICISFNMFEMMSKFQNAHFFNYKIVEENFKKKKINLTPEQIKEK